MRKRHRKLDLHRETLIRLEPGRVSGLATDTTVGDVSSCTYECGCPDSCSAGGYACLRGDAVA